MIDIKSDLSYLTDITEQKLINIGICASKIIAHKIACTDDVIYSIDIGIGELSIWDNDGKAEFRFYPSNGFIKCVETGLYNPQKEQKQFEKMVEKTIVENLIAQYGTVK